MQAQRGALDVQIVDAGLTRFGSSKVPTRTKIKCGRASASLQSGVPQAGQNRRCIRLPLSATLEKSLVFPMSLNASVRKQAPTVPLPAPRYWQSRHQHTRVVSGGSVLSQRTAPQRHLPVTVIALSGVKVENMLPVTSYSCPRRTDIAHADGRCSSITTETDLMSDPLSFRAASKADLPDVLRL